MDNKSNFVVYETTNYGQFKKLLGNRDVTAARLSAIKESILRIGYQPSPILINHLYEVIDGQGRLAACEALGLPILYIIKPGLTIDDCISMNIKMKNWGDMDYIKCWADRGYESYINLMASLNLFPLLNWIDCLNIVGQSKHPTKVNSMRNGKLVFSGFAYDEVERARWITILIPMIKESKFAYRKTVDVLIRLDRYGLIDKKRMLEQFENYAGTFNKSSVRASDVVAGLDELYNYNRRIKQYFSSEYKRAADSNQYHLKDVTQEVE